MQLQDYISQCRNLVHDPNAADFSNATLTTFANTARTRVALDTQCVQTYLAGLNTIPQQEQYPLTGFVGGVVLTSGGSKYTNPTATVTGGGGTGAAVLFTTTAGVITAASMSNWGTGYTSAASIAVTDATGSGAALTPVMGLNILNWLQPIDILWGSLRVNFDYLPFITFNTYARAYTAMFSRPGCFTVHLGNQTVFLYPLPDQVYPMAPNVSILPSPLVNLTDVDTQVITPWSDAVQYFMAFLCMASLQRMVEAAFWYSGDIRKPGHYDMRVRQLPASVTPYRVPNPYLLGRKRVRRM